MEIYFQEMIHSKQSQEAQVHVPGGEMQELLSCKHPNTSIMRERNTSPRCQLQYNLIVACNAIVTTIP
jgi:hypothetical protein